VGKNRANALTSCYISGSKLASHFAAKMAALPRGQRVVNVLRTGGLCNQIFTSRAFFT
jgi:hypothetical protein